MKQYSDKKLIASGSIIESYFYKDQTYIFGEKREKRYKDPNKKPRVLSPAEKALNKAKSLYRSRKTLERLVNANAWKWNKPDGRPYLPIFVTLTFAEEIRDVEIANKLFSKFIKRLNYEMGATKAGFLKYAAVIEFQDKNRNGVVHYHVVFFNLNHIWKDRLAEIWGRGIVHLRKIRNSTNVGKYMTKYMSKEFDDGRLDGHKHYFPSNGLYKPNVLNEQLVIEEVLRRIPSKYVKSVKEFDSPSVGRVEYRLIHLKREQSLDDAIYGFL